MQPNPTDRLRALLTVTALLLAAGSAAAGLTADVTLTNTTGGDKTDWPVFLTIWKVFGPDLPDGAIDSGRVRVLDADGNEIPHMPRRMPPAASPGSDEIVFLVKRLPAGASLRLRVVAGTEAGKTSRFDLHANPNNLLPPLPGKQVKPPADAPADAGRITRIDLPAGAAVNLAVGKPVRFRKGVPCHFSFWAKTDNVAHNGWGFRGSGVSVKFDPPAFRGRESITLRGRRAWYCYRFDAGGADAWGVDAQAAMPVAETVRKGRERAPAPLWAKARGMAQLRITGKQTPQPFLVGDKSGRLWLSDPILFAQPTVSVDRASPLKRAARHGAVVFARPVNMPRCKAFAHEAADRLEAFAMRGQRVQLRLGVHAVTALGDVTVTTSPLVGAAGQIPEDRLELETLGAYVTDYAPIPHLTAGHVAEFLLGIDVPAEAAPGVYTGSVRLAAGETTLADLPVVLEILPVGVGPMTGYWVGGIYNIGMGMDRNDAFYRAYGKARFNYLLLFDYLFGRMKGGRIDFDAADAQVRKIVSLAKVTGGIGLYREPNMSEDQPRKWYQIASGDPDWQGKYKTGTDDRFEAGYRKRARAAADHARKAGWPELVYMVSDEPGDRRDVDPSMGWLNRELPRAVTIADVQFKDMVRTWDWYNLPVLDDPVDWTGPLVYEYVRKRKGRFGICGTGWRLDVGRYQPGLMLAGTGACYWHFWHTRGPFEPKDGKVVRSHTVAAMAAGVNDLRYYLALKDLIAANRTGPNAAVAAEADKYLRETLALAPGDHDRHLMPHNGVPWHWGDVRFYDRWRKRMKDCLTKLSSVSGAE